MFYKVVMNKNGKLFSIDCPDEVKVKYIPNQFVFAKYGQLLCFDDLEKAKSFHWRYKLSEIWECEVGKQYKHCYIPNWLTIRKFTGKWWGGKGAEQAYMNICKLRKNKKKYSDRCWKLSQFPYGTVLTDKIKLIRMVTKNV